MEARGARAAAHGQITVRGRQYWSVSTALRTRAITFTPLVSPQQPAKRTSILCVPGPMAAKKLYATMRVRFLSVSSGSHTTGACTVGIEYGKMACPWIGLPSTRT